MSLNIENTEELHLNEMTAIYGGQDEVTKAIIYQWEYFWGYVLNYPNAAAERAKANGSLMSNAYLNSMGMH